MRDVNNGWILRYIHANVASFFFIFVYAHVGRGIYYGSYHSPRTLVWSIGVIILILMMAIAFLGYVLPYGQMSLWGWQKLALNNYFLPYNFIFMNQQEYLNTIINILNIELILTNIRAKPPINYNNNDLKSNLIRIRADKRIGPHNKDILCILFASLLGDAHAERRTQGNGTRITFYQEGSHASYLIWLHNLLNNLGYCSTNIPKIQTRLGKKGKVRKIIRFRTWTYTSFNWIHDLWYIKGVKCVPLTIGEFITPIALAIWIMDDGGKVKEGLKLATNAFSYSDCLLLVKVLFVNFKLKATVQSAGIPNQYHMERIYAFIM